MVLNFAFAPSLYLRLRCWRHRRRDGWFKRQPRLLFGFGNIFTLAQMIPPEGIDATVWGGAAGCFASLIIACVLTLVAGLPRSNAEQAAVVVAPASENDILAPMTSSVLALDRCHTVPSPAVCWGKGVAIIPSVDKVIAPFSGEVASIFKPNTPSVCW